MGSCVSSEKNVSQESPIKNKNRFSDIPSLNDNKPTDADVALNSQRPSSRSISSFRQSGSQDDRFFDSTHWLESDCEDDFFSVNGDMTPSRGSTPLHPSFMKGNSRVDNSISVGNSPRLKPGSSPAEKKKELVELFRDSIPTKYGHLPNLITKSMYEKQLDSGKGTLLHLCDDVIQQEVKEVIVSFFLLMEQGKSTREDLDRRCEDLIKEEFGESCNFDVDDAVRKLENLGIVVKDSIGRYSFVGLKRANEIIGTTTEELVLKAKQVSNAP